MRLDVAPHRVHLRIQGLVQGVSYRASARDEATRLGVVGWVRNLHNGDVEAEAQGAEPVLQAFVDWCRHGPDEARVTHVEVSPRQALSDSTSFQVLR